MDYVFQFREVFRYWPLLLQGTVTTLVISVVAMALCVVLGTIGDAGAVMAIDHFGASAPGAEVLRRLGFTVERVTEVGRAVARAGLRGRVPTLDSGHQPAGLQPGLRQPPGAR